MPLREAVLRVQRAYPRIYLACHTRHQNARTTGERLSQRDGSILAHLSGEGLVAHGELARHLGMAKSTLTEALQWLEQCGYVSRHVMPEDARNVSWQITAAGDDAVSATSVLEASRVEALLALLTPEQQQQALAGIELLAHAATRMEHP